MSLGAREVAFNHATFGWSVPFGELISVVSSSGAGGVGIWSDKLDGLPAMQARARIEEAGLRVTAVNRGGFFVAGTLQGRQRAIDETLRQIDVTHDLGSDVLLIVPGGLADDVRSIDRAREHVLQGLEAVLPHAAACGIRLGIEPFHPGLTTSRGVTNTLDSALDLCDRLGSSLGVILDVHHLWWDPNLHAAISRAGDRILGLHLCDWALEATDPSSDRVVMGEGVADIPAIIRSVRNAGYKGFLEVEIFSRHDLWRRPPRDVAKLCLERAMSCIVEAEA